MPRERLDILMFHYGTPRDRRARDELAAVLPGAEIGEPDEVGVFQVSLEADDHEDAVRRVRDAVAASGTDDHLLFLEHPNVPAAARDRGPRR